MEREGPRDRAGAARIASRARTLRLHSWESESSAISVVVGNSRPAVNALAAPVW